MTREPDARPCCMGGKTQSSRRRLKSNSGSLALRPCARAGLLWPVSGDLQTTVLKGVSRSFYLTLRLLPGPMRSAASLGYLLARTSDTIADTATIPVAERLALLAKYGEAVERSGPAGLETEASLLEAADPREAILLKRGDEILEWLAKTPPAEAALVREVVAIIISGQRLDLERFADASGSAVISLRNDDELEDYAWRVAGCVGAFWTKLGFLTLGRSFSDADEARLLDQGIAYGKGLQLVNILRDLPGDLTAGRCYLPVADSRDRHALLECHARWLETARAWVAQGEAYAATLRMRRLRMATVLPVWLAQETLEAMRGADWERLSQRVKVPRSRVYRLLWDAWIWNP